MLSCYSKIMYKNYTLSKVVQSNTEHQFHSPGWKFHVVLSSSSNYHARLSNDIKTTARLSVPVTAQHLVVKLSIFIIITRAHAAWDIPRKQNLEIAEIAVSQIKCSLITISPNHCTAMMTSANYGKLIQPCMKWKCYSTQRFHDAAQNIAYWWH